MLTAYALSLIIGAQVQWEDPNTHESFCGTLTQIDHYGRAWILPNIQKQFYSVQPVSNVKVGCIK